MLVILASLSICCITTSFVVTLEEATNYKSLQCCVVLGVEWKRYDEEGMLTGKVKHAQLCNK